MWPICKEETKHKISSDAWKRKDKRGRQTDRQNVNVGQKLRTCQSKNSRIPNRKQPSKVPTQQSPQGTQGRTNARYWQALTILS